MIPVMNLVREQLKRHSSLMVPVILRHSNFSEVFTQSVRRKQSESVASISRLLKPFKVAEAADTEVGAELSGTLKKSVVVRILCEFANKDVVKDLCKQHGLDDTIFTTTMGHFRKYCLESKSLPTDLHVILNDITQEARNIVDIFPYFLRHAKQMYPHIDYIDELKKISDLRNPSAWYPLARCKNRKLIFHAGPTNSGKTYNALKRFMSAKSGVYCGPLKLLANEVYNKCNAMGTPCDLVTGEEIRYAKSVTSPSDHISCSVEMVNLENNYEVAVIDEVQLLRDPGRGWAWTRALLGLAADEIHLCGEYAAIPIVQSIGLSTGESVEVKEYKRLTSLEVQNTALTSFVNVEPGDCIVCFSRNEIFAVSKSIEKLGKEVAVIYGSLPPGTKIAQAARFNDPDDPCKILVATNAIGMGLNLHIRRIIFYSLSLLCVNEKGEMETDTISVSSALQIAGRAGRYGTQWPTGYVTTYKPADLPLLKKLLDDTPEEILKAGLHPTLDQLELYAYYLPNARFSNLINIFTTLCTLDSSQYFICNLEDFKFIADMIEHISLPLRTRYTFCCAPVNKKMALSCAMILKYARQCSINEPATITWMCRQINWPPKMPMNLTELLHLEGLFDVLDIYLWLSYRMPDLFPDADSVRQLQMNLDKIIETGVKDITNLFKKSVQAEEPTQKVSTKYSEKSKAKLSQTLLSRGLLTPKMLQELKQEWYTETASHKTKHNNPKWKLPK